MKSRTNNTRHDCALCREDKLTSEMFRDWYNGRALWKCHDCVQDIYALEMELAS